jgi:hypothetical protein
MGADRDTISDRESLGRRSALGARRWNRVRATLKEYSARCKFYPLWQSTRLLLLLPERARARPSALGYGAPCLAYQGARCALPTGKVAQCPSTPKCPRVHPSAPQCPRVHPRAPEHTRVRPSAPECAWARTERARLCACSMHGCCGDFTGSCTGEISRARSRRCESSCLDESAECRRSGLGE